ncbi:MAG: M56 family metallopeptidase, partial [Saprospiraceae bacterium]
MPIYLFSVSLAWLIFYAAYYLLLRRERLPVGNRLYLLATFLLGLLLPLLPAGLLTDWLPAAQLLPAAPGAETFFATLPELTVNGSGGTTAAAINWLNIILLIGGLLHGLRCGYGLWQINRLHQRAVARRSGTFRLLLLPDLAQPFTFGRNIFWNPAFDATSSGAAMLAHEAAHVRQGHTLDLLLVDLAGLLFWWNPLLYAYRRGLAAQHEFAADAAAARVSETRAYARLLLTGAVRGSAPRPAHTFFSSPLKQRITMLTSPKGASWKLLLTLPLLLIALWACNQDSDMTGQRLLDVEPQEPLA